MKIFRVAALATIVVGASACASRPVKSDAPPVAVMGGEDAAPARVNDPWEDFNRRTYGFNNALDKVVIRPVAVAYDWIVPDQVQASVARFFGNLREPATAVNQALQQRPAKAVRTLGRFVVNSTVGLAGLFDPASRFGMAREQEDFGQTLATWGWRDSRYFVMPLFGPRTVRDTVGMFGDQPLSPIGRVDNTALANSLTALQITDARAGMLQVDGMHEFALDEYAMVRDMWMRKRAAQIDKDL
jgi:phospholipid-binding lipoprotein MlaA